MLHSVCFIFFLISINKIFMKKTENEFVAKKIAHKDGEQHGLGLGH